MREARLQLALREAGFARLPTIVAVGEDESVLGVPFYVMTYLDGTVPTDELPPGLEDDPARGRLGADLVDALVEIHAADVTTPALAAFARPGATRASGAAVHAALGDQQDARDPDVEGRARLAGTVPEPLPATAVHGDFGWATRWSPATIRPGSRRCSTGRWGRSATRADVGYLLATYSEPGGPPNPLGTSPVTALPGFPTKAELVERYAATSGREVEPLHWFEALALWKAAVFCEAIYGATCAGSSAPRTSAPPASSRACPTSPRPASASRRGA